MQNTSQNTTNRAKTFTNRPKVVRTGTVYDNMVILRRDLYYKDIVNAHSARIEAETEKQIGEIMYRYDRGWLSKKELFADIEALNSGYPCTDIPVKNVIKLIRSRK